MVSILEYSLHFATVLSRWAREYTNEVGALEVLQKIYSPPQKKILILFSEGTHPVGEGACRKNATSSRCPRSATKNIFPPQNPYTNPLEIT